MASILIVETDRGQRALLERELQVEGHTSLPAASDDEAWDLLTDSLPDLVLVDMRTAALSGFELVERLDNLPRRPRVVIHSSFRSPSLKFMINQSLADAYVMKQSDLTHLKETIREVLVPRDPNVRSE